MKYWKCGSIEDLLLGSTKRQRDKGAKILETDYTWRWNEKGKKKSPSAREGESHRR